LKSGIFPEIRGKKMDQEKAKEHKADSRKKDKSTSNTPVPNEKDIAQGKGAQTPPAHKKKKAKQNRKTGFLIYLRVLWSSSVSFKSL
jgi:hypothetical protein